MAKTDKDSKLREKYSKLSKEELLKEFAMHYSWELQGMNNSVEILKNLILEKMK